MKVNPIDILPDEKSTSDEWVAFWNALKKVYGESAAKIEFIERWSRRGASGAADVVAVQDGTGLTLSKGFIDEVRATASHDVALLTGLFDTMGKGTKIVFWAGIGLAVLLVGGVVIRVITLSSEEAGVVAGTAAKAFV